MTPPEPKRPPAWANWRYHGTLNSHVELARALHVFTRGRLLVISSIDMMDFRGETRPQWLISISVNGPAGRHRPSDAELGRALRDFGMGAR